MLFTAVVVGALKVKTKFGWFYTCDLWLLSNYHNIVSTDRVVTV